MITLYKPNIDYHTVSLIIVELGYVFLQVRMINYKKLLS